MAKKNLINDKVTIVGLICSFVFGLILGGIVYLLIKIFNLKNFLWFFLFIFIPPIIGGIIYALSKAKINKA